MQITIDGYKLFEKPTAELMTSRACEFADDGLGGADRVDLFTGSGDMSEHVAGGIRQKGALFFLLKKESPN
jgi:hypothetical protein